MVSAQCISIISRNTALFIVWSFLHSLKAFPKNIMKSEFFLLRSLFCAHY